MTEIPQRVFVLMPFDERFRDVYELVIKSFERGGEISVDRADTLAFDDRIIYDKIVSAIDRADLVIADLSDNNPNVFYELGYAHARGKIVIPITSTAPLPFDIAGFETIFYELDKLTALKGALAKKIREILALRPILRSTSMPEAEARKLEEVEAYALAKARQSTWSRPAMYFTEQEVIDKTGIGQEHAFRALDSLRTMGKVNCVNWKGEPVWMAAGAPPPAT